MLNYKLRKIPAHSLKLGMDVLGYEGSSSAGGIVDSVRIEYTPYGEQIYVRHGNRHVVLAKDTECIVRMPRS